MRRSPIEWQVRSPDLNPLHVFLCGYLKKRMLYFRTTTNGELNPNIYYRCLFQNNL